MLVSDAVAAVLTEFGADTVFGVVGSGNFHVTNAMVARGARYVAARHEGGAACMADGWARLTGRPGIVSVHQGPGLTNAMTGITEAAKSRTPMIVLAADVAASALRSNFRIDVRSLAAAVGATPARLHSPGFAVDDTIRAYQTAVAQRRTVVLALPLDVQAGHCEPPEIAALTPVSAGGRQPAPAEVATLAEALRRASRPVFIAGRGARNAAARAELELLASHCGALLATSAAAKGLFRGSPWDLDVSGGFASPLAAELVRGADLVVGWGCSLNMWTLRHGSLIGPGTTVAQVDDDPDAIGGHRPVDIGVVADVRLAAAATAAALRADATRPTAGTNGPARAGTPARAGAAGGAGTTGGAAGAGTAGPAAEAGVTAGNSPQAGPATADGSDAGDCGYRSAALRERIARQVRWRDVSYQDESDGTRIDPRTLSIALDDLLPADRLVAVDSGNFMGYPSMYLSVPDQDGFCFTQAYQSVGLGLSSAIGAAIARPDRLTVAALGDGGALMAASELETVVRLGLPMVIVVYDDEAYGAEVHHFGPDGHPLDVVRFPPADIASIGAGFGYTALTVRTAADLQPAADWLAGPRETPLLIDAKVTSDRGSWWLEEAFRGH